ncbi:MAG: pilus assembly protein TadG-related protein [Candidatus Brocadiia bacterium]
MIVGKGTRRNGQVVVMAAFALILLALIAALTIDIGYMFCQKARLQNAGDAAANAAAFRYINARLNGEEMDEARSEAEQEGTVFASMNSAGTSCEVQFGEYVDGNFVELGESDEASAIRMGLARDEDAPGGPVSLFFGSLMGYNSVDLAGDAVVEMSANITGVLNGSDLRPFAVYEGDVQGWTPGSPITINLPDASTMSPVAPGNWGWLNLDGGSLGTKELKDWIDNGYDGDISLDETGADGRLCTWIGGSCGVRKALQKHFENIVDDNLILCIYDKVTGNGANAQFRIVGFISMTYTSVDMHGKTGSIEGELNAIQSLPYCEIGDGASPESNVVTVRLVQ